MLGFYALGSSPLGAGTFTGGGGTAYTLSVSPGTYSISGQAATFILFRLIRSELPYVFTPQRVFYYSPVVPDTYYASCKKEFFYTVIISKERTMAQLIVFPQIGPNQIQSMGVDFGQLLPANVTLTGTPTVTVTAVIGTDASAASRVTTTPIINTIPIPNGGTGIVNAAITWQVGGVVSGVTYQADVYCYTTSGDRVETFVRFPGGVPS